MTWHNESSQDGARVVRRGAHPCGGLDASPVLTLEQAASMLHMRPRSLSRIIHAGELPASRVGRRWLILAIDLMGYLRSKCTARVMQGDHVEGLAWHSIDAKTRPSGGSDSSTTDERYKRALGLPTE
jgi:excisionase family DNA binding protein